ncbi:helix-turn-helix domain-containing protein [Aliiroseovarius sp.]|uniref:GlxA family transcriptional regulator n=1 Tax=Aliiroseovarius sp. TaxID=1872442 RepID=UPI002619FF34|nr:helix-turn-helix domain-containing protein [Aliiroseovarius sp.]
MQSWEKQNAAPQRVDLLLFDHFSGLCLANTVEPMRAANQLSGRWIYEWRFLTVDGAPATSSSGMTVAAEPMDGTGDMLIALPSYHFIGHATPMVLRALRAAAGRYATLAGFDTGAWLLAAAGLLEGRRATIHWEELDRFEEAFPEVRAQRKRHVVEDNRITCSGAQAAFDLMVELIGAAHGPALRLEVAMLFMSPGATGPQDAPLARGKSVARAVALMQEHLEDPLRIPEIARRVGRPLKDLEARMQRELGAGPQVIYRRLRLIAARKLVLETGLSVAEIALRAGYQDASAFTRAFRAEFGQTPREMRLQAD